MNEIAGGLAAFVGISLIILLFIATIVAVILIAYGLFFKKRK